MTTCAYTLLSFVTSVATVFAAKHIYQLWNEIDFGKYEHRLPVLATATISVIVALVLFPWTNIGQSKLISCRANKHAQYTIEQSTILCKIANTPKRTRLGV